MIPWAPWWTSLIVLSLLLGIGIFYQARVPLYLALGGFAGLTLWFLIRLLGNHDP